MRLGFIRKVYSILSLQLIVTAGIIVYFVFILPQHYHDPRCHQVGFIDIVMTVLNINSPACFVQNEIEDFESRDYNYDQVVDQNSSVLSKGESSDRGRCDKM